MEVVLSVEQGVEALDEIRKVGGDLRVLAILEHLVLRGQVGNPAVCLAELLFCLLQLLVDLSEPTVLVCAALGSNHLRHTVVKFWLQLSQVG